VDPLPIMIPKIPSNLALKLGLAIVLVEGITLAMVGYFYSQRFSAQIDLQVRENLLKPGMLMSHGILNLDAVGDTNIMNQLVGPGVVQAMVVGANGNIFHSLDPAQVGMNFDSRLGVNPRWLVQARTNALLFQTREAQNSYHVSLASIQIGPGRAPFLFVFIKLRTTEIEIEKAAIAGLFLLGSLAAIVATSLAILWCFRWLISTRLSRVLAAVERFENGDLTARIPGPGSRDEIGILQQGVNDMAGRLQETIHSLELSLSDLKATDAARRENEENFRHLFELAPIPLVLTQRSDHVWLAANRAAHELLKINPASDDRLPTFDFHANADDRQKLLGLIKETGGIDYFELGIKTQTGEFRWVSLSALPVQYQRKPAILISLMDLTDRKQAEDERLRLERKLQETQKLESLGVLAGGIAHDFNNLLTGIIGNASLARQDLSPVSPALEYLVQVEKSALRAADLCRQMLAYSGKGRFLITKADLNAMVQETVPLLHLSISKKAILRFELGRNLPPMLVDAAQVHQVIMNLVMNASDAIGDQEGVILIRTALIPNDACFSASLIVAPEQMEKHYVLLEVKDNGCGMSEETQSKIFDPFFTTKFTGRGLGLAAVLGIIRGHKGGLRVESQPGQGSSFCVMLPPAAGVADQTPSSPILEQVKRGAGEVLVVDDEAPVRVVAKRMLESFGFTVQTATNGREALSILSQQPDHFRLILLDLTMPQMDGEQTLREIHRLNCPIPVLLMSGYNEQETIKRFAGLGLAGFLQKPFNLGEMREKIQSVLS
jgi:PAS domain S-box-containing protein